MVRAGHQFAPAVTFEKAINGGRSCWMPDLLLISLLDVRNTDQLSSTRLIDKALKKRRFFSTRHILVQPPTTRLKIQSLEPITEPGHMHAAYGAARCPRGIGYFFLCHPMRCTQMDDLDPPIPRIITLCLLQRPFNLLTFLLADYLSRHSHPLLWLWLH